MNWMQIEHGYVSLFCQIFWWFLKSSLKTHQKYCKNFFIQNNELKKSLCSNMHSTNYYSSRSLLKPDPSLVLSRYLCKNNYLSMIGVSSFSNGGPSSFKIFSVNDGILQSNVVPSSLTMRKLPLKMIKKIVKSKYT